MDPKLCLLAVLLLAALVDHQVDAEIESRSEDTKVKDYINRKGKRALDELFKLFDYEDRVTEMDADPEFYFQRVLPKAEEVESLGLKCVPGRTLIQIKEKIPEPEINSNDDDDDDANFLRSHMNTGMKEEYCKVCVCSVDGKDEYCSERPAMNVNECLLMAKLKEGFQSNGPFEHTRTLANRIRRDYIWHNDEIPYEPKARCRRGHSYYSNSRNANETDIDVASDVESLLDYDDSYCVYCVCHVDGRHVKCINRMPMFCEYIKGLRSSNAARDMYTQLFQQDRPTYFRQISWRLRRTMDNGMYDFLETGGDALCCSHPDGHRRNLHNSVRSKIRGMRRKTPKENLLSGYPGGDYTDFVVNNDK